jgi:hypothetical protein
VSLSLRAAPAQSSLTASAGEPIVSTSDTGGSLHNNQIRGDWQILSGRLGTLNIQNAEPNAGDEPSIVFNCPFSIELQQIGVQRASDLLITGSAKLDHDSPNPAAARASDRLPGVTIHYSLADPAGRYQADWALTLRQGSSYIRQILTVTAESKPLPLSGLAMIDIHALGIAVAGTVKGSPLTTGNFFLGFESPLSESSVVGDRGVSELHSGVPIGAGQSVQFSSVVGLADAGQMRRAFLTYLERERAHPYRTFLHYNSWFDIGFFNPYTQQEALNRIHAFGDELNKKRGVTLD